MEADKIALPEVVSREEWLVARKKLLEEEKRITRLRDELNAKRRRLPMFRIEKEYLFEGPDGKVNLFELFEGRRQLLLHHFMWFEKSDHFCHGCSFEADQNYNAPFLKEMNDHEVTVVAVARAPYSRIEEEKRRKGWNFPFYSSRVSDFNYDFQATIDEERNTRYNYSDSGDFNGYKGDLPAKSVFLRDGGSVYHTYSAYTRGLDQIATHYNYLDLTPYGRQEAWEDSPEGWPQNSHS